MKSITLLSVDQGIHNTSDVFNSSSSGVRGDAEWSVRMQRLQGGLSDGVDVVWLDNGCTKLAILPTRGMGIWKGTVAGTPLEWKSPVERPVNPAFVDPMRRGGIGWLDGFNEIVCRCGLGWHGAPGNDVLTNDAGEVVSEQFLPLHGRIANLSAHEVTVSISEDGAITIVGVIDEASVFGGKLRLTSTLTTYIGSNSFEINDAVKNCGSASAEVEMLYHCNFGPPFLDAGSTFHMAASKVAPRDARAAEDVDSWTTYKGPTAGYAEQCYFASPIADEAGRALAVVADADRSKAFAVRFDVATLPMFTLWKNTQAEADGYCTGLEPGSSLPNLRSVERRHGRVINLPSDETITFELAVSVATDADGADALVQEVNALQGDMPPTLHSNPLAEFSP